MYEDQYTSIYPVEEQFGAYALLKEWHGYKSDKQSSEQNGNKTNNLDDVILRQ